MKKILIVMVVASLFLSCEMISGIKAITDCTEAAIEYAIEEA